MADRAGTQFYNSASNPSASPAGAVSNIGDFNGDGFDDFIISDQRGAYGGPGTSGRSASSYVVFGSGVTPTSTDLDTLDGTTGFKIVTSQSRGYGDYNDPTILVEGVGDVDGDGYADIAVGSTTDNEVAIIFGGTAARSAEIQFDQVGDSVPGARIDGFSGTITEIDALGDVNGDGRADFAITQADINYDNLDRIASDLKDSLYSYYYGSGSGSYSYDDDDADAPVVGYVILGATDFDDIDVEDALEDSVVEVLGVEGSIGVGTYYGGNYSGGGYSGYGYSGYGRGYDTAAKGSVEIEALGDINGDGFDDFAVRQAQAIKVQYRNVYYYEGSGYSEYSGYGYSGYNYIGRVEVRNVTQIDRTATVLFGDTAIGGLDNAVTVPRPQDNDDSTVFWAGHTESDDRYNSYSYGITGNYGYSGYGGYLGYGGIYLDDSYLGVSNQITGIGDFNGDGYDDVALSATDYDNYGNFDRGVVGILFGGPDGLESFGDDGLPNSVYSADDVDVAIEDSSDSNAGRWVTNFGTTVKAAGDVNNDGFDDLLVSAYSINSDGVYSSNGLVYLIFGSGPGVDVPLPNDGPQDASSPAVQQFIDLAEDSDGIEGNGYIFTGLTLSTLSSATFDNTLNNFWLDGAGDVDGDGNADFLLGSSNANSNGRVYLVLGGADSLEIADNADGFDDNVISVWNLSVDLATGIAPITVGISGRTGDGFARGVTEGTGSDGVLNVELFRGGDLTEAVSVDYMVSGATPFGSSVAATADDFAGGVFPGGTVTFAAGSATAQVSIQTDGDAFTEENEYFKIALTNLQIPDGATGGIDALSAELNGVIFNDDFQPTVSATGDAVEEGEGPLVFQVDRFGDVSEDVVVDYVIRGFRYGDGYFNGGGEGYYSGSGYAYSSATSEDVDGDLPIYGEVTILAGSRYATVDLGVVDDTETEYNNERVTFEILGAEDGSGDAVQVNRARAVGTIFDNDQPPRITAQSVVVTEGTDATFDLVFTRTGRADVDVTATYQMRAPFFSSSVLNAEAADIGGQALPVDGTVFFAAGDTEARVTFTLTDDTLVEGLEYLEYEVTGATSSDPTVTPIFSSFDQFITINDNESVFSVTSSPSVTEGDGTDLSFTISRTGDATFGATVTYDLVSDVFFSTSQASSDDIDGDLPQTGQTIRFEAGETSKTVTIGVIDDDLAESSESIRLQLTDVVSDDASVIVGLNPNPSSARGDATIFNDDNRVNVFVDTTNGDESGTDLSVTFRRSDLIFTNRTAVEIDYEIVASGSNPVSDDDITGATLPLTGTITLSGTQSTETITIPVVNDELVEGSEQLTARILAVRALDGETEVVISDAEDPVFIIDDDIPIRFVSFSTTTDEDTGSVSLTIRRFDRTDVTASIDVVIDVNTEGLTSADDDDVVGTLPLRQTVTFDPFVTSQVVTFDLVDDQTIEGTEYLSFTLENPTSSDPLAEFDVSADTYRLTITDDDRAVEVSAQNVIASEADGQITFTIIRSGNTAEAADVTYTITGTPFSNTASASDLVNGLPQATQTLSFAPDELSKTLTVDIVNDRLVESNEQFYLNLTGGSTTNPNVTVDIQTPTVAATIQNDDVAVDIRISDTSVDEGSGAPLEYTFTRSGNTSVAVSVDYEVQVPFSTATASDFVSGFPALTGTVNFAAGETSQTVSFDVLDDIEVEANETLQLRVTNVDAGSDTSVRILDGTGVGTIVNDDFLVSLSVDSVSGAEDGGPINVTVRRTGDTSGTVTAEYLVTTAASSSASQADVVQTLPLSGNVVFAPGQTSTTFQVTPVNDSLVEASEFLAVTLTGATSDDPTDVIIRQTFPSFIEITSDDQDIEIRVVGESRFEDEGFIRLFVDRIGDTTKQVTADYTIASFDTEPDDLTTPLPESGTVTFAAGETRKTITLGVVDDLVQEPDEFIQITLTDAALSGADAGGDTPVFFQTFPAFSRIRNDDIPVTFSVNNPTTLEGGDLVYTITRRGPSDTTATLDWDFGPASFSPAEPEDLTDGLPRSGTLTFAAGVTQQILRFGTEADAEVEGTEYTALSFSNATSTGPTGAVAPSLRYGTIADNNIVIRGRRDFINEDDGALIFDVVRSGILNAPVTVDYVLSPFGAGMNDDDIVGNFNVTGQLSFAANESTKSIVLNINPDDDIETTEYVALDFTGASTPGNAVGIDLQNFTTLGYVYNDDFEIELSLRAFNANEGDALSFFIYRSGDTQSDATVSYTFAAGGSDPAETLVGDDLVNGLPQDGTVTFAAGETSKLITLDTAEDMDIEGNEGVTMSITGTSTTGGNTFDIGGAVTGLILNDDFPVTFRASGSSGFEDTGLLTFTVQRSGNTAVAASIDYTIPNTGTGSFATPDDITGGLPQSGTLNFVAGETFKTITLLPVADSEIENTEIVQLLLSNAVVPATTEASVQTTPAYAYIWNDDLPPAIEVSGGRSISEGNSGLTPITFTLSRTGSLSDTTTVDYSVGGGTADSQDFAGTFPGTGSVTFAPGQSTQTVTVNVAGDRFIEPTESFFFSVTNIASSDLLSYTLRGGSQGVSIINDDGRPPLLPPGVEADVFGDPHIVTLDGLTYSFMAVGEYVLLESLPGQRDPFQIQVRFEPAPGSDLVSITTRMAVEVAGKTVELSALDGGVLLIDGVETTIDPDLGAIDIDGDDTPDIFLALDADSNSMYTIVLNGTNEQLKIGVFEGYMNVCVFLAEDRESNVRGLMGNADGDTANDLALRDGTILEQPPEFDALYGSFANSWRVEDPSVAGTEKAALFTYIDGQGTSSFDNPDFPAADVSLDDIPADILAKAEAAADDAGITDPILREAAILDFAFTGDESFLTGATGLAAEPTVQTEVQASDQDGFTVNVFAETREITEQDNGKTTVQFTFYRTGDATGTLAVDYEIAGTVDADDLDGGTALSGTIVIEDGAMEAVLDIAILGDVTTEATENLDVRITGVGDGIVGAASARTVVVTDDFGPVAVDDTFGVTVGETLNSNVLSPNPDEADSDADNDTLTVVQLDDEDLIGGTASVRLDFGTVTILDTGEITYTPDERADALASGEVRTDTFAYKISDGNGGTDEAEVEISVIAPTEAVVDPGPDLPGTDGPDTLVGGDEDESIDGGGGLFDILTGGGGIDTFIFTNVVGSTDSMTITDYMPEDRLDLQGSVIDFDFSFGGATYLYLNGAEYDQIIVNGADSIADINFV